MQKKISFLFLVTFSFYSFSQSYNYIDSKVKNYSNITNTVSLSNKIKNDFTTDEEKIRALFIWLVENMQYRIKAKTWTGIKLEFYLSDYQKKRESRKKETFRIKKAMKTKKANCYGFSLIFKEVCDLLNIESHIIIGYSKGNLFDIGNDNIIKDHSWNSIKINNQWQLIDVSWAIGYRLIEKETNNDYYYFKNPNEFVNQHLPANPKWQLLSNSISKKEFVSTPILHPKYYRSEFKLSNEKKGVIKISKTNKYFTISFKKLPKDKKISYAFLKDSYSKRLFFKKSDNGTYNTKIKFTKKSNSYLTIYSDLIPLVGYKIQLTN